MSINSEVYQGPARRSDVGRTTINLVVALRAVQRCLLNLQANQPVRDEDLSQLAEAINVMDKHFEYLSGWQNDER